MLREDRRLEPVAQLARGARTPPRAPATASSAARAKPTAYATFSVPGRRPRSCAPPCSSGSIDDAAANEHRADALGRADLVARTRCSTSNGTASGVDRDLAERLHGVGVKERAARLGACRRARSIGWTVPISLFTHMTVAIAVSSPTQRRRTTPRRRRRRRSSCTKRSSAPSRAAWCTDASTALCSIGVVTIALRPSSRQRAPGAEDREVVGLGAAGGEADLVGRRA